jgi:hypothetical protein
MRTLEEKGEREIEKKAMYGCFNKYRRKNCGLHLSLAFFFEGSHGVEGLRGAGVLVDKYFLYIIRYVTHIAYCITSRRLISLTSSPVSGRYGALHVIHRGKKGWGFGG